MKSIHTFAVAPRLPEPLTDLHELASNLWWCWNPDATTVFHDLDPELWHACGHNPRILLARVDRDRLEAMAATQDYVHAVQRAVHAYRAYRAAPMESPLMTPGTGYVAYFCAEFGIHESFPCYSGGLGVLAGDHIKSASDLGLPLVGVGLLYSEGYFRQHLSCEGWQEETAHPVDVHNQPLERVCAANGEPVMITVDLPGGTCWAQIWRLEVGRVPIYLLDSNVEQNRSTALHRITDRLYGGDVLHRIQQEILLGIGGIRALQAVGIIPSVLHINEGHAAFAMLERTRHLMSMHHLNFEQAWLITQGSSVFTTHTPVPAGNEVFDHTVLRPLLGDYVSSLGITWEQFARLGADELTPDATGFSMTILGLRGSSWRNGVSRLHGAVARSMWADVWPHLAEEEVPISSITNGVHTRSWIAPELASLLDTHGDTSWHTQPHISTSWQALDHVSDADLWAAHCVRRERLVHGTRAHILRTHHASLTAEQAQHIHDCLDPKILTIGFARRFATYKRADLILHDMDRLERLITHSERPIQMIMAGKAHPKDDAGKELIKRVHQIVRERGLERRIVFLEDYDMDIARMLVRGCDVWLNTPQRPHEASGTSGMKAALNGVLHFSILDGWWAEGYHPTVGFSIGTGIEYHDNETQDAADAASLYDTLEHVIAPMFYRLDTSGTPTDWVRMMRSSITTLGPTFSSLRMVHDYAVQAYQPATLHAQRLQADQAQMARAGHLFLAMVEGAWEQVRFHHTSIEGTANAVVGSPISVRADLHLGLLQPNDVCVEAILGTYTAGQELQGLTHHRLHLAADQPGSHEGRWMFEAQPICDIAGTVGCTIRVVAAHPALVNNVDRPFVAYAP